jgi:hypothetical protein
MDVTTLAGDYRGYAVPAGVLHHIDEVAGR